MNELFKQHKNGFTLDIKAVPGAGRDELKQADGVLQARVRAIADGGKANEAVVALLSKSFGVPKSYITILKGHTCRQKTVLFRVSDMPRLK